jgi:S-adenosylmethionine decarboxylase
MFQHNLSAGKHMICDLKNIKNTDLLNNPENLNKMLQFICDFYQFQVIDNIKKIFQPQGCTILYLLSESHLSIHTFPERDFISFDLYTCREYKDNKEYLEIYDCLVYYLQADPNTSSYQIIDRFF